MGYTGALFGSEVLIIDNDIVEKMHHVSFGDIDPVYISDHFDRSAYVPDHAMTRISLFDGTLLAYVDPKRIVIREYDQAGSIRGSIKQFEYVNEVFFGPSDVFCVFFLILPKNYYPQRYYVPSKLHFAARVGEKIRLTWWFKESIQVKLQIKLDEKKFTGFDYIESTTFIEKHPKVLLAYREVEDLVTKTLGETFSP